MAVAAADDRSGNDVTAFTDDDVTDTAVSDVEHANVVSLGPFSKRMRLNRRVGILRRRNVIGHGKDAATIVETASEPFVDRQGRSGAKNLVQDDAIDE